MRSRLTPPSVLALGAVLLLLAILPARADDAGTDATLEAGFGVVDLSPDRPVPLAGYAARLGRAHVGTHDPLKARAVVLRQGGTSLGLVSVDLIGVSRQIVGILRERTRDLDLTDLVVTATHTHGGIGGLTRVPLWRVSTGKFDAELFISTVARVEAALRRAHADLGPVRAQACRIRSPVLPRLIRNRASPDGAVDATLGLVRLDGPDGVPRGILTHFAAHPTLVPASSFEVSAGWPGSLCAAIEREIPGATALFLQGALGDVSPVAPPEADGSVFDRVHAYGEALARVAMDGVRDLDREPAAGTSELRVLGTIGVPAYTAAGALLGRSSDTALTPRPWKLDVARFQIAGVEFVTVPGEPTQAAGRALGQADARWIVACAQDHLGYFADRALFRRGDAYEVEMSLFGPDAVGRIGKALRVSATPQRFVLPLTETPMEPVLLVPEQDQGMEPARALGSAHGHLLGPLVRDFLSRAEAHIVREVMGHGGGVVLLPASVLVGVPSRRLVMPAMVRAARRLQRFIPVEYLDEMEGLAEAARVPYDAVLLENVFLTLAEQRDPASLLQLPAHCTNAVALGKATSMGQLIHASTLDWGMGEVLKTRTIVLVQEPATGAPFVSVTWPGMVGTLRAMGAQGIAVTEESCAAPDDTRLEGLSVGLLLRSVVQHATSLSDAVRRIREAPGTCGYKITVSDGHTLDARVVEVGATHRQVRRPVSGLLFGCDPDAPDTAFVGPRAPALPPTDGSSRRRYPALRAALAPAVERVRTADLQQALASKRGGVLNNDTLLGCVFEPQLGRFHVSTGRDVGVPDLGLRWRTFALTEHLSSSAVRERWFGPWPVKNTGEVSTRVKVTGFGPVRIEEVRFTSPVRSGLAQNDEIRAELFTPTEPKGVVIQLPHWKEGPGAPGQRLLALGLAAQGFAVLILPLPYQHERAPEGVRSGRWTLSHDLARTRAAALQGAADVARAGLWLEEARDFAPARQAVLGVSLGGHVASLTVGAYPDRFGAGVFVLTASGIAETLFKKNGITDGIRSRLLERGVAPPEAAELLDAIDPARFARADLAPGILLVAGSEDPVTPPARVEALAKAWGGARVQWFEGGHYGLLRHLPEVLQEVSTHLQDRFESP